MDAQTQSHVERIENDLRLCDEDSSFLEDLAFVLQLLRRQEKLIEKLSAEIGFVSTEAALLNNFVDYENEDIANRVEELFNLQDLVFWISELDKDGQNPHWKSVVGKKIRIGEYDFGIYHDSHRWIVTELVSGAFVWKPPDFDVAVDLTEFNINRVGKEKFETLIKSHLKKLPPKPVEEPIVSYESEELEVIQNECNRKVPNETSSI